MLERREALLRSKLAAADEVLTAALVRKGEIEGELRLVQAIQQAEVGKYLTYIDKGVAGGGFLIGRDGDRLILMDGPAEARIIKRVDARRVVGVHDAPAT